MQPACCPVLRRRSRTHLRLVARVRLARLELEGRDVQLTALVRRSKRDRRVDHALQAVARRPDVLLDVDDVRVERQHGGGSGSVAGVCAHMHGHPVGDARHEW